MTDFIEIVATENIIVYGECGKRLAAIDNKGNVTYEDLTLEDAKEAIRILLEKILEVQNAKMYRV